MFKRYALMVATSLALGPLAFAQEHFPIRPIQLIVPTAAGSGMDATFRLLATLVAPALGQNVIVLDKPGGSSSIGIAQVTTAKPDGYTIGAAAMTLAIIQHTIPVPFKRSDYIPITMSMAVPIVFCVKKDFPAETGQQFLDVLVKNPDKYTYATDGQGGSVQLIAERIFRPKGAKARDIPYTDAGTIGVSFLGGVVDIYAAAPGPIVPYIKSGVAKCLLVSTAERNPTFPNAQGINDLGIPDGATTVWRGLLAPAGTPADRIAILEQAFMAAAKTDKFKQFAEAQGGYAVGGSSADFARTIDKDLAAMGTLVDALGLRSK